MCINNSIKTQAVKSDWNPIASREKPWRLISAKKLAALSLISVFIVIAWYLRYQGYVDAGIIFEFINKYPLLTPLLFVICHILALLFMVPSLPLNLGAGMLWGPLWGGIITTIGGGLGAVIAFAIARTTIGQPLGYRFDNRWVAWLQDQIETKGWRVVAFTRINPIFPSSPLNYIFGVTSIRFTTYAWSSVVFLFFPALAISIVGHEIGDFVISGKIADIFRMVFIVSAVLTFLILLRFAAKLLVINKKV